MVGVDECGVDRAVGDGVGVVGGVGVGGVVVVGGTDGDGRC